MNPSLYKRIEKAAAQHRRKPQNPVGYAVITLTDSGTRAIVFEKKVNWVGLEDDQINHLCALLQRPNGTSSATAKKGDTNAK